MTALDIPGEPQTARPPQHAVTVLVVDDNRIDRMWVTRILGPDCHVVGVETLAEAQIALEQQTFDAVVLDRNLPDGRSDALAGTLSAAGTVTVVMTGEDLRWLSPLKPGVSYLTKGRASESPLRSTIGL